MLLKVTIKRTSCQLKRMKRKKLENHLMRNIMLRILLARVSSIVKSHKTTMKTHFQIDHAAPIILGSKGLTHIILAKLYVPQLFVMLRRTVRERSVLRTYSTRILLKIQRNFHQWEQDQAETTWCLRVLRFLHLKDPKMIVSAQANQ